MKRAVPSEVYDERYYYEQDGPYGWRKFLETRGRLRSQGKDYIQSLGQLRDGMRVLDVGCGRGEFIFRCVQDHCVLGVGIDYSAAAVNIAYNSVRSFGTEEEKARMIFTRADAQSLPFSIGTFDVIYSHHVIEHLYPEQLEKMLSECKRVLRDSGRIVFETGPNLWRLRYGFPITRLAYRIPLLGEIYRRMMGVDEIPQQSKSDEDAIYHVGEQSVLSLKKALQRNGFKCKVWVGLGQDSRFTKQAFQKRFGKLGLLLCGLYFLLYGVYPFKLVFDDVIYATASPDGR